MDNANSATTVISTARHPERYSSKEEVAMLSDLYVDASTPRHQDIPPPELEPVSGTQKYGRGWVAMRWKLSRSIFSVPLPMLTARFDIKCGDLVLTLPFLIFLFFGTFFYMNERDVVWSGIPATFAMAFVFGTAVRNNSFMLSLTGIPFDRALLYHKVFSYATIVMTMLHAYTDKLYKDEDHEEEHDTDMKVFTGAVAFFAMVLMYLLSLNFIRRRYFELFLRVHWILFIVVIVFAVWHGATIALLGIVPWFIDMLYRLLWHARTLSKGRIGTNPRVGIVANDQVSVHLLPGDVILIQFPRVRKETGASFKYDAAQYAFLCIPEISYLEWHPFTISSAPDEEMVTFHIKNLGDWWLLPAKQVPHLRLTSY